MQLIICILLHSKTINVNNNNTPQTTPRQNVSTRIIASNAQNKMRALKSNMYKISTYIFALQLIYSKHTYVHCFGFPT